MNICSFGMIFHRISLCLGVLSWTEPVRARPSWPEPARGAIGRIFSDFQDFPEKYFPKKYFGRFYLPNPRPEPASLPKPIDFYWISLIFSENSLFASWPLRSQPEFPQVLIVHSGPGQRCPCDCGTQNPQPVEEN